jgi:hypothetical protein
LAVRLPVDRVHNIGQFAGEAQQELTMNRFAFAAGLLAVTLGLAAATPARADFAVVQFASGYCKIWWDSSADPWGARWKKIAIGLPDWDAARATLSAARSQGLCQ